MSRTLVTIATDGFRDYVSLPNGDTINLGTTSVLKLITEVVPFSADIRKALDTFLAKGTVTLAADQSALLKVLRPKKSRWAAHENRFIPVGIQDPNGVWNSMSTTKELRLTPKEVERGEGGVTVVVRPQEDGGYWVAAVDLKTRKPLGKAFESFVDSKSDVPSAVKEVVRWLSKMGIGDGMAESSRNRRANSGVWDSMSTDLFSSKLASLETLVELGIDEDNTRVARQLGSALLSIVTSAKGRANPKDGDFAMVMSAPGIGNDTVLSFHKTKAEAEKEATRQEKLMGGHPYVVDVGPESRSEAVKSNGNSYFIRPNMKNLKKSAGTRLAAVDADAKRELDLFIENEGRLAAKKESILTNLLRKLKSDGYNHSQAPKLWMYLVDEGAKMYAKEMGSGIGDAKNLFPKELRESLAKDMADNELELMKNGEYDHLKKASSSVEAQVETVVGQVETALQVVETSPKANTHLAKKDLHIIATKLAAMVSEDAGPEVTAGLEDLAGKVAKIQSHFACGGGCSGHAQSEAESLLSKVEDTFQVVEASGKSGANLAKKDLHTTTVRLASLLREGGVDSVEGQKALRNLSFNVSKIRSHFASRGV